MMKKQRGFTLVELLVALSISVMLLLFVPPAAIRFSKGYQERIFVEQLNHDLKLAQVAAQTTGKGSTVEISGPPYNEVTVKISGKRSLNHITRFPDSIHYQGNTKIQFKADTGQLSNFNQVSTFKLDGYEVNYFYTFQLGGRFYVTVSQK